MAKVAKPRADSSAKVFKRTKKEPLSDDEDEMPRAPAKSKRGADKPGKKKKDPNAPKRGLSAYMFYANANRDRVRSENPEITFGQVGKVLGEEWKALDADEKSKYEDMAKKDKKRYEDQKAAYNAEQAEEAEDSE